jgi:hypothetical protein
MMFPYVVVVPPPVMFSRLVVVPEVVKQAVQAFDDSFQVYVIIELD